MLGAGNLDRATKFDCKQAAQAELTETAPRRSPVAVPLDSAADVFSSTVYVQTLCDRLQHLFTEEYFPSTDVFMLRKHHKIMDHISNRTVAKAIIQRKLNNR